MNEIELLKIRRLHEAYLANKDGGVRADLSNANLSGVILSYAKLSSADLSGANLNTTKLHNIDLHNADLSNANLCYADLSYAILHNANLEKANLKKADLRNANLTNTRLHGANLYRANLEKADFWNADLSKTDLNGANLRNTNLNSAGLGSANLSGTCLDPAASFTPPTEEEFIDAGFDKVENGYVYGWRTERTNHVGSQIYETGKTYTAPYFSIDKNTECHPGIYFAPKGWLEKQYLNTLLVRCRSKINNVLHVGDKWRTKELEIL